MGQAIAIIGLTAAILQLIKYGIGLWGKISSILTSVRSTSQSIQEWEDQLETQLNLVAEFETNHRLFDDSEHKILLQCKNEADAVDSLLQQFAIVGGNGNITRLRKAMKLIQKRDEMTKRLSKMRQLNERLHQQSLHWRRIGYQWDQTSGLALYSERTHSRAEISWKQSQKYLPDTNLLHHIIGRRNQILQALSILCNTTSNNSIVMLAIMSCSDSFDISANSLAHFANGQSMDIISFLSRQGIITPNASSVKFKVDMETASLIRAELKSMSRFPKHLETVLCLLNANLPPNFQSSDALQQDSSYPNLAISILGVLMELCHESQLSKSSLDVVLSMTTGITRFLSNAGLQLKAKEIIERMLCWGSDSLSSDYIALSMLKRQLAIATRYQGHLEDAEKIESEVLWLHTNHHGESHIETIRSLNNYALALQEQHKFTDAERYHSMALSMKERMFGRNHAESLISVHNLGEYFQALGQHRFAEKMFCRALSKRQILFKPDHPAVLRSKNSLGVSYYRQGRYEEAEQIQNDCLSGRRKLYGDQHLETIRSTGNLALTLSHRGKVAEAEILLHKVVIAIHELLGPDQPETIQWYQNLARFLRDRNRYLESETVLREWLPKVDRSLGRRHFRTVDICRELAIVLHEQEKYSEALEFAIRVRDVRTELSGHDDAQTLDSIQHVEDLKTLL